ncbi:DUF898 family protein [Sphingomonas changnyeongensis]|uniref:DUF898 family protein n=2 Tax=Sphingomonas changnyeongensis TaxID=2698679 RepID=A0A7Z2NUR5_9SPHN|nr:DUF898 family protein [Sphingomonas changnyeongensis]
MAAHDAGFDTPDSAFVFTGRWREFLPIAVTNLLLTIVTLGIYRFWATTRTRRYLWANTQFIDDRLEWAGTGGEMFRGFLVVLLLFVPALLIVQSGIEALAMRGELALAGLIAVIAYAGLIMLVGVARYRALRYRLSRTYWHGIHGGGTSGGWGYGASYLAKSLLGALPLGLAIPWSMTALWNERWNAMGFGPHRFAAEASTTGLMGRWLLVLASPVLVVLFLVPMLGLGAVAGATPSPVTAVFAVLLAYALIALLGAGYYAAFMREVIGNLALGPLRFTFTARTADWIRLFLGHALLVIGTLGLGAGFIAYRNWAFFIRHLEAMGHVDLDALTQSPDATGGDAEGLATAFDIGAI